MADPNPGASPEAALEAAVAAACALMGDADWIEAHRVRLVDNTPWADVPRWFGSLFKSRTQEDDEAALRDYYTDLLVPILVTTLKDRLLDSDETREVARVFIVEAMLANGGTPEDAAGLSHAALSACRAIIFADADRLIREAMEVFWTAHVLDFPEDGVKPLAVHWRTETKTRAAKAVAWTVVGTLAEGGDGPSPVELAIAAAAGALFETELRAAVETTVGRALSGIEHDALGRSGNRRGCGGGSEDSEYSDYEGGSIRRNRRRGRRGYESESDSDGGADRKINWLHVEKRLDFFRGELADIRETIASNLLSPEHAEAFQASIPAMEEYIGLLEAATRGGVSFAEMEALMHDAELAFGETDHIDIGAETGGVGGAGATNVGELACGQIIADGRTFGVGKIADAKTVLTKDIYQGHANKGRRQDVLRVSDMMVAMTQRFEREAAKREASRDRHYFGATPGDAQAWRPAGHLSNFLVDHDSDEALVHYRRPHSFAPPLEDRVPCRACTRCDRVEAVAARLTTDRGDSATEVARQAYIEAHVAPVFSCHAGDAGAGSGDGDDDDDDDDDVALRVRPWKLERLPGATRKTIAADGVADPAGAVLAANQDALPVWRQQAEAERDRLKAAAAAASDEVVCMSNEIAHLERRGGEVSATVADYLAGVKSKRVRAERRWRRLQGLASGAEAYLGGFFANLEAHPQAAVYYEY